MPLTYGILNNFRKSTTILVSSLMFVGSFISPSTNICIWEYAYPSCEDSNVLNGYWWRGETWIPMYPSVESWFTPAPLHFIGDSVFYSKGVMEANAEIRGFSLSNYLDGVALMSPADIGLPVWIKRPNHSWEGPFLVVDSSMRGDVYPLVVFRNDVVEVGWETAKRWEMVDDKNNVLIWKMINVEVSKINPNNLSHPTINYQKWWLENLEPATFSDLGTPVYIPPSTWRIKGIWVTFESPDPFYCCEVFHKVR